MRVSHFAVFVMTASSVLFGSCTQIQSDPPRTISQNEHQFVSSKPTITSSSATRRNQILSAYHGLDELPFVASLPCRTWVWGKDGMPVTFSVQINNDTLSPDMFVVETSSGKKVVPICATLRPAMEPLERRTVLLVGDFGSAASPPRSVEVVGPLQDIFGRRLSGLRTSEIRALTDAGPKIIFAERFDPVTFGLKGECPNQTKQVIQTIWEGGVSGPGGDALGEAQRIAVMVKLEDGRSVHPIALADDDPDNYVLLCLAEDSRAVSVSVLADIFHDPADVANPKTAIKIVDGER